MERVHACEPRIWPDEALPLVCLSLTPKASSDARQHTPEYTTRPGGTTKLNFRSLLGWVDGAATVPPAQPSQVLRMAPVSFDGGFAAPIREAERKQKG